MRSLYKFIFILLFLLGVLLGWPKIQQLGATVANNGLMNYGRQADTGMNYARTFSAPSTVNAEYTDTDTSASAINFIRSVAAPTREEKFVAHQKADGQLDVLTCTTNCDAVGDWTLRGTLAGMTAAGNADKRAFDVAYEQLSGRAMVVFADDPTAGKVYYCLWDGASWSPSANCGATFTPGAGNAINLGAGTVPMWIRLVAQGDRLQEKRSNEMLLAVVSATSFTVARWTGSAWTDITNTSSLVSSAYPYMDIAWESVTGNGLVVFDLTANDGISYYRKYVAGTGWDSSDTAGPDTGAGNNNWTELASDPMSNRISMIIGDSENDAHLYIWKSNNSTAGFTTTATDPVDGTTEAMTGKAVATVWSRFNTGALFSFTDSNALTQDVYCWTIAGFTIGTADVGGTGTDDVDNVIYVGSPNDANAFYMKGDIVDDLTGGVWNGGGCAAGNFSDISGNGVWANDLLTGVNTLPIPFTFAYNPYSPWSRNWRWTDDTVNSIPASWLAVENTGPTGIAVSAYTMRLRLNFAELGAQAQTDARKKLQYSTDQSNWTDVDAQGGSGIWRYADCAAYNDNSLIATTALTGTNQTNTITWENGTAASTQGDHNSLGVMEADYCLQSNGAANSTTYYFRAWDNDQQTPVFRQQTSNPATPCAGATTCAYPSLVTADAAVSLTFDVSTNNFGNLTPGTPRFATSTLSVKTANSAGWNVVLYGNDQSPTDTVCDLDSDANTGVTDQIEWVSASATTTAGVNAVRISSLINSGDVLAFRVMTASGTQSFISTNWWGTVDDYADNANTLWAGVASSTPYRQIGNSSVSTGGATSTNTVLYYLDFNTASTTGQYSCPLTFTATANP